MKTKLLIIFLLFSSGLYAQEGKIISGESKAGKISFRKSVNTQTVTLIPDLVIKDRIFTDENKNNIIDARETTCIKFTLENNGKGEALDVKVKVTLINDLNGLDFNPVMNLGTIYPTQTKDISIPVYGGKDLKDAVAEFKVEVIEKNGLDAFPFEMKIETSSFKKPEIVVADAVFSTDDGGKIKLNYPVNLKVLIQNIGQGEAKDVNVEFILENANCLMLDETNKLTVGNLKSGETGDVNFSFTATRRYEFNEIPVRVVLSESYGLYAENKAVSVGLEQNLAKNTNVVIKGIKTESTEIAIASLVAEVDKNIPVNSYKFPDRYALIIGNEDYSGYQQGLSSESDVEFARNDAKVFREYAEKTLGINEQNIYFLTDATAGEMQQKIELVSKIVEKIGSNAELIFYYAGHGYPDENTKVPYLIPVDVNATNLTAAIRLSDIYKKFSRTGAKRITVLLDACFSGGGRETGLLAARGVKIKPKDEMLGGNMVVFTAGSGEQSALPYKDKKHGMFTYFMLKKIQETGGDVTYGELKDYISRNVSIESLKINQKEQDPKVNVSTEILNKWQNWKLK
jgi:hypothetical protein